MNPILTIDLLVPILVLGIGLALFLGWRSSATVSKALRIALLALRSLGLAGLVVLALNPGRWTAPVERADSDWAVLVEKDGAERLYFVVETKSTLFTEELRDKEGAKVKCGEAHFQALAVDANPAKFIRARDIDDLTAHC